jgi:hypothetical protein
MKVEGKIHVFKTHQATRGVVNFYNASVVTHDCRIGSRFYTRAQSYNCELQLQHCKNLQRLVRFENKNFGSALKKCPSLLQRWRLVVNSEVVDLAVRKLFFIILYFCTDLPVKITCIVFWRAVE